jgi:hypothetical protein
MPIRFTRPNVAEQQFGEAGRDLLARPVITLVRTVQIQ